MELLIPLPGSDTRIANAYKYVVKKKNEAAQEYSQNASEASSKANYNEALTGKKQRDVF
jgi:hypothetical protein